MPTSVRSLKTGNQWAKEVRTLRILVDAFTKKNLGDDLFLKILFDRYPSEIQWIVLCDSEEQLSAFQAYRNVRMFQQKKDRYTDMDAVINIGGSIFMQNRFWWIRHLLYRLSYAIPMKWQRKPLFIVGCNYGPSNSKWMYLLNKWFIRYFVSDICFRDKKSYHLFRDLKQSRYSPDIVYGLDVHPIRHGHRDKHKAGICIMHFSDEVINRQWVNKMTALIERLCSENETVELFSFCREQKDLETYQQMMEKLGPSYENKIKLAVYDGRINDFLLELNSVGYLITLRFHSLVLAHVLRLSYYPIVYSNKTSHVLDDLGIQEYTHIKDIGRLDIDRVLHQIKQARDFPIHRIKAEAEHQFKTIDRFLFDFYTRGFKVESQ
ncbi:polysaccharide pyruvyl transferase family protein [Sporolactobacillus sp. THM7-7]|nr:polysaccharide pyruvyl transferase family protein [Sporolactobacillus sp. THM7-7]